MAQTKLTYPDAIDYLKQIATQAKFIDNALELENDDVPIELQKLAGKTVMVIEDPKSLVTQGSGSRVMYFLAFHIVKYRSTKAVNVKLLKEIKSECEQDAFKVLAYLKNQRNLGNLTDLDFDNIDMMPLSFEGDWHGYRTAIPIRTAVNLQYDENDWN